MAFDVISRFFRWLGQSPAADQPEAIETIMRAETPAPPSSAPEAAEPAAAEPEPATIAGGISQSEDAQVEATEESNVVPIRPKRKARRGKRRGRAA